MLEPIVQHQKFTFKLFNGGKSQRDPILSLEMRHIRQVFFQNQSFVVWTRFRSVAAAQNGDAHVTTAVVADDVFDERRLAGSADRKIADANHRRRDVMRL